MNTATQTSFPVWKQITIGNLGDSSNARDLLKAAGVKVSDWAAELLRKMPYGDLEEKLDLVRLSAKDLELDRDATVGDVYFAAGQHGLLPCPAEVGPQIWIQHPDLLLREAVVQVAMREIENSNGYKLVFCLQHLDDGIWLGTDEPKSGSTIVENDLFIFVRT